MEKLLNANHGSQLGIFLTDTKSVLQTPQSRKLPALQTLPSELGNQCKITLQWTLFHFEVPETKELIKGMCQSHYQK